VVSIAALISSARRKNTSRLIIDCVLSAGRGRALDTRPIDWVCYQSSNSPLHSFECQPWYKLSARWSFRPARWTTS
jgi:hypothetical protein